MLPLGMVQVLARLREARVPSHLPLQKPLLKTVNLDPVWLALAILFPTIPQECATLHSLPPLS